MVAAGVRGQPHLEAPVKEWNPLFNNMSKGSHLQSQSRPPCYLTNTPTMIYYFSFHDSVIWTRTGEKSDVAARCVFISYFLSFPETTEQRVSAVCAALMILDVFFPIPQLVDTLRVPANQSGLDAHPHILSAGLELVSDRVKASPADIVAGTRTFFVGFFSSLLTAC